MRKLGQPLLQCADGGFGGGEDFAGENRLGHALNLRGGPGIAYVGADFVGVLAHHAVYGGARRTRTVRVFRQVGVSCLVMYFFRV